MTCWIFQGPDCVNQAEEVFRGAFIDLLLASIDTRSTYRRVQ